MVATTLWTRRSSRTRSGWNRIVSARASISGPTMPAAALIPVSTMTKAAAPTSTDNARDGFIDRSL